MTSVIDNAEDQAHQTCDESSNSFPVLESDFELAQPFNIKEIYLQESDKKDGRHALLPFNGHL